MIEINTPHYLERRTKRLFAFELQIVKTISGSFVEMNLTIKDSLKQLVNGNCIETETVMPFEFESNFDTEKSIVGKRTIRIIGMKPKDLCKVEEYEKK